MTTSGPSQQSMFGDGSPTHGLLPTPQAETAKHVNPSPQRIARYLNGDYRSLDTTVVLMQSSAASPASRSPSPANSAGNMTPAISGLPLLDWLPISGRVGSVLRTLAASSGWRSTICSLTWTVSATPRGRWLFRLRASARSTAGIASGLWPTPNTPNGGRTWQDDNEIKGNSAYRPNGRKVQVHLHQVAEEPALARMWPTPVANDDNKSVEAHLAMKARMKGGPREAITSLQVSVKEATGNNQAKLNPDFVCRLMGFPDGWLDLDS